jgi:UDP-N-acetylglucosamine/UDP-N-acetylgalactosamine diphosphorylase
MISFPGYDSLLSRIYQYGHDQVLSFWDRLSDAERRILLDDVSSVDFELIAKLYKEKEYHASAPRDFTPASFIPIHAQSSDVKNEEAYALGVEHIKKGCCAAFVVAGGQGSRLGFEGPKGAYKISPVKNKSLFQLHVEKVLKCSQKYDVHIPILVMTSELNHEAILTHFRENNNFGCTDSDIIFFPQNMIPSLDGEGKIVLSAKNRIFKNPDGHGGSVTALRTSGALDILKMRGIKTISYFQVDNPLVRIIDPLFIGHHLLRNAEVSSKIVVKQNEHEKVGVFVRFADGHDGVIEYSDMPTHKIKLKNSDGSLAYNAANLAIHLFDISYIEKLTGGDLPLPFHTARKKIDTYTPSGLKKIDGLKFEKFVFDAIPLAERSVIMETTRAEEFAPVKNAHGDDSPESTRKAMTALFRDWLDKRGIHIPKRVSVIEISPLAAVDADDLDASLSIPDSDAVYIE